MFHWLLSLFGRVSWVSVALDFSALSSNHCSVRNSNFYSTIPWIWGLGIAVIFLWPSRTFHKDKCIHISQGISAFVSEAEASWVEWSRGKFRHWLVLKGMQVSNSKTQVVMCCLALLLWLFCILLPLPPRSCVFSVLQMCCCGLWSNCECVGAWLGCQVVVIGPAWGEDGRQVLYVCG